jgi:serine/threonine protein kinase
MRLPILPIGIKFEGRYLIHEFLDHGAMGQVYRATDTAIDQEVALKFVYTAQCQTRAARGFREFATARQVGERCVHILRIHDITSVPAGDLVLIMEMLDGVNLRDWMIMNAPADWTLVRDMALQIANGLKAMHRYDYIHRDIKPENIFTLEDEDGAQAPFIKLIDFGIVKDIEADALTATSMSLGTQRYMPPELFHRRKISDRSDIFSFGVVLFELLAGFNPLPAPGDYNALVEAYNSQIQSVRPHCNAPDWFTQLVDDCLRIDPKQRPSAVQFITQLRQGGQGRVQPQAQELDEVEAQELDEDILIDEAAHSQDSALLGAAARLDAALAMPISSTPPPVPPPSKAIEPAASAPNPVVELAAPPPAVVEPSTPPSAVVEPATRLEEAITKSNEPLLQPALQAPASEPATETLLSAPFVDEPTPSTYSLRPPSNQGSKGSSLAIFGGLALIALAIVYVSTREEQPAKAPPPMVKPIVATEPKLKFKPRGPVDSDDFPSAPRTRGPMTDAPVITAAPGTRSSAPATIAPATTAHIAPTKPAGRRSIAKPATPRRIKRRPSKSGVRNSFAQLRDRARGQTGQADVVPPTAMPVTAGELTVDESARPLFFDKKKSRTQAQGPALPVGRTFAAKLEAGISSSMQATVIARLTADVHVGDTLVLAKGDVIRGRQGNDSTRVRIDFTEAIHKGKIIKFRGHAISNGEPGLPAKKKAIPKEERGTNVVARGALRTAGTVAGALGGNIAGELAGNVANEGANEVRPDFRTQQPFVLTVPKGTRFRVMVTGK